MRMRDELKGLVLLIVLNQKVLVAADLNELLLGALAQPGLEPPAHNGVCESSNLSGSMLHSNAWLAGAFEFCHRSWSIIGQRC